MKMYCPHSRCHGTVDALTCIYQCKVGTKVKCVEFARNYLLIKEMEIDEKYILKYGEIFLPIPLSMRKRRKKRNESNI